MSEITKLPVGEIVSPTGEYATTVATLRKNSSAIVANAESITTITTGAEKLKAVEAGRLLQAIGKQTAEFYKGYKTQIDQVKKVVLEDEHRDADKIAAEKQRIAELVQAWDDAEAKRREAETLQARTEARSEAEERLLADAVELEAQGRHEEAAALLEHPTMPLPVIAQKDESTKVRGQVTKTKYRGTVVDFTKLVRAVAAGKVPLDALLPNQSFLNDKANDYREGLDYPGVEVQKSVGIHFRS